MDILSLPDPWPPHSGIIKTTGSDAGPFPNTLVTNMVIDTLPLEVRQGEGGLIFSVCTHVSPLQVDACIVSVPQSSSDANSE